MTGHRSSLTGWITRRASLVSTAAAVAGIFVLLFIVRSVTVTTKLTKSQPTLNHSRVSRINLAEHSIVQPSGLPSTRGVRNIDRDVHHRRATSSNHRRRHHRGKRLHDSRSRSRKSVQSSLICSERPWLVRYSRSSTTTMWCCRLSPASNEALPFLKTVCASHTPPHLFGDVLLSTPFTDENGRRYRL